MSATRLSFLLVFVLSATAATAHAQTSMRMVGTGHNLTCDESTGVSLAVTLGASGYHVQGAFDGVNLFGRFDALGQTLDCSDSPGATCMQFVGSAEFGNDGSGFPPGTHATFVLTLVIHGNDVTGIYQIGRLPSIPYDQYGTLTAAVLH
jgi:hypothetical protein